MTKYNSATIVVAEGLSIKKISGPYYHYHFRINGKLFRKSTKTGDKRKAKLIAEEARQKALYEIENGIISETISFNSLAQRYLKSLDGQKKQYFHEGTLRRHLKPFFGKFCDVTKIKHHHLDEYLDHRKSKYAQITNGTLNKEAAVFNQMMAFALKRNWLQHQIKLERNKETSNPRPHFTQEQLKTLKSVAKARINELKNKKYKGQESGLYQTKLWSRQLIYDLAILLVDTGIRPCEIKTIRWQDINWKNKSIKLYNAGKVSSNRSLFIRSNKGINALKRIQDRRITYVKAHEQVFNENEYIQSFPNGKQIKCIKKGLKILIDECAFKYSKSQQKHSLYSFRHTYATYSLAGIDGKKIPIRALAMQMGTSIEMIEKHYGHDSLDNYREFLIN
tara:strand:+ start:303 stop:1478 length:1176 start_codon:yes stop_codon:yes gene_type:complete